MLEVCNLTTSDNLCLSDVAATEKLSLPTCLKISTVP